MRKVRLEKLNSEGDAPAACVCSLRQVPPCILDLIKSGVRQRHVEREEAAFAERGVGARMRMSARGRALTFFYMLKLMERNKRCHHSFSPPLNTHTHTRARARTSVLTRSILAFCKCPLQNVSSLFLQSVVCCESQGLCQGCVSALSMFSAAGCDSLHVSSCVL